MLFLASMLLSFSGILSMPKITITWPRNEDSSASYVPKWPIQSGWQLVMVYIGSSTCAASNLDIVPPAVERARLTLAKHATAAGWSFSTIGIAVDWDAHQGIEHLRAQGTFDEMIAGNNWINLGVLRYVWEEVPGHPATPSIVVLARKLQIDTVGVSIRVEREHLLARNVGADVIKRWTERGAPVPDLATVIHSDP
ncbi:MAG: hypothetical protein D6800_12835 [Candidatus Zixiibacteriota bacterium]|nr:MAG: hypothetical protein D6800_12835 [candidate division Zixibacteria bacterium]